MSIITISRKGDAACAAAWAVACCQARAEDVPDVTHMPMEQLLDVEVSTVARDGQKQGDAAAGVSVVTIAEIRQFGMPADVPPAEAGCCIASVHNYDSAGMRRFSRAGDCNNRVVLLMGGYRFHDGVYGKVPLGQKRPFNLDLTERIKVICGPGPAVNGNHAGSVWPGSEAVATPEKSL